MDRPPDIGSSSASAKQKSKKPKRAEIRKCPVCDDDIPVRLLDTHRVFELQRVEDICRARTQDEDLIPWEQIEADVFGASGSNRRGAALKARRFITAGPSGQGHLVSGVSARKNDLLARVTRTIKLVQRHRRERHMKLKVLFRSEEEDVAPKINGDTEHVCPVCQTTVDGDDDVVEAHIDACLTHAGTSAAQENADLEVDGLEEYEAGGETRIRISRSVDFRGAGFDVRDPSHRDVEDDIDIDGDDAAVFGEAQFSEKDIILPDSLKSTEDEEINIEYDMEESILLAPHNPVRTSLRDLVARRRGSDGDAAAASSIITTTGTAGSPNITCRICFDGYTEPTVSTGCWHTCCRECWLRCLGTTKLCPICKRITAAGDLRRIFL